MDFETSSQAKKTYLSAISKRAAKQETILSNFFVYKFVLVGSIAYEEPAVESL